MNNSRQLSELSRQELYELIWTSPVAKVAADFGIADVVVHKQCIRLKVPRPTPWYWAKIAAGRKARKKPLPPTADELFVESAQKSLRKSLALPETETALHPLAMELMQAISKAKSDSNKRARVREVTLPETVVSKLLAERVAKAFHVILNGIEPIGILFRKSLSSYDDGYFKRGNDRLYLNIEETLVDRFGSERRDHDWQWRESAKPSGRLAFKVKTQRYGGDFQKEWIETAKMPLERILAQIVSSIREHFLNLHRKHVEEEIERKKRQIEYEKQMVEWRAKEAIRLQKEREQMHARALKSAADARVHDLFKAAEWWNLSRSIRNFVEECERRWKISSGELLPEQTAWLAWANELALTLSPFSVGYPDAAKHGAFDPTAVGFGGPYPSAQNFSKPPALPIIQSPGTPLV